MKRFLLPLLLFSAFMFGMVARTEAQFMPNVYALTEPVGGSQQLLRFPLPNPASAGGIVINGIMPGDKLIGIDFAPSSTTLYGVGQNFIYQINVVTGVATPVAPLSTPLVGFFYGIAFDPSVPNLIRVNGLNGGNQNLLVNSTTGVVTPNPPLFYVPASPQTPIISGVAYNRDFAFMPARWYGINPRNATLLRELSINAGAVQTVGSLGFVTLNPQLVGFDIYQIPGTVASFGFAALAPAGTSISNFYFVNLNTGGTISLGQIGSGYPVNSISIR